MAEPTSAAQEAEATSPESSEPTLEFPLNWLLDHAAPPIQYRSFIDVAQLPTSQNLETLALASPYALQIAVSQSLDGTWGGRMLSLPKAGKGGVAGDQTIPAVRRLLESGWHRHSETLAQARRPLLRLCYDDHEPHY